jgi:hypothetical protein
MMLRSAQNIRPATGMPADIEHAEIGKVGPFADAPAIPASCRRPKGQGEYSGAGA